MSRPEEPDPIGRRWREWMTRRRERRLVGPLSAPAEVGLEELKGTLEPESTAFVLAGGGSRGAAQVGMLAELVERGIRADRVYGASVGAVNAAAYSGDPTPGGSAGWRMSGGDSRARPSSRRAGSTARGPSSSNVRRCTPTRVSVGSSRTT